MGNITKKCYSSKQKASNMGRGLVSAYPGLHMFEISAWLPLMILLLHSIQSQIVQTTNTIKTMKLATEAYLLEWAEQTSR
jgi:hypothetical protein